MNIAYIAPKAIPSREANGVHVMKMCSALAGSAALKGAGGSVTLVVPENAQSRMYTGNIYEHYGVPESFDIKKIRVYFSRVPVIKTLEYGYKAARYTGRNNFSHIYSRDISACFFLSGIFRKFFVFEFHEPVEPETNRGRMLHKVLQSKYLIKMVVVTKALGRYFISQFRLDEDKVYAAPDGADEVTGKLNDIELTGSSKGFFHVGYIGHLYKGRGIELIGDMANNCKFAFFHIIGGTESDIAYWKDKYAGIKNIHFYGYVPPSQTPAYGKCMDVLIAPYQNVVHIASSFETGQSTADFMSPLKMFEYMALGKPIVCSDMPVLKEVLSDGENALLCPAQDADAWSIAIGKLYEDKGLHDRLAAGALGDFPKYTWSRRAENLMEEVILSAESR